MADYEQTSGTDDLRAYAKRFGLDWEIVCCPLESRGCVRRFAYWRLIRGRYPDTTHQFVKLGSSVAQAKWAIEQASGV